MKKVLVLVLMTPLLGIGPWAVAKEADSVDPPKMTHEQLQIAVQAICPVSGQKLGEHGKPIKVQIGQEQVYLCCRGCAEKEVETKHWATIHANFARAQAKCPVMDKPLPEQPKWAIVEGQIIYICCPPCAKKLEAEPKTYLRKVDELYRASLQAQRGSN